VILLQSLNSLSSNSSFGIKALVYGLLQLLGKGRNGSE